MYNFDVFVNSLSDLREGEELNLSLRDLSPGTHKYCYKNAVALVSADENAYPHKLQVRFGRGQAHDKPYSVKIVKEIDVIPEKWK